MAEITQLDQAGLALIRQFEGCILHPYLDSVKIPTIGIGMTYYPSTGKKVTMADPPISQAQADNMFLQIAIPYEKAVYSLTRQDINQNQFNALFCFCYNIGVNGFKGSTVLKLVNQNISGDQLKAAFMMWDKAGGQVNQGLANRRAKEYEVYMS